jgi:hypothetical protein
MFAAHRARCLFVPAVAIVVIGAGLDVAQWLRATPLWVDEEMIALNVRDRAFMELPGALWFGQSAPLGWLFLQRSVMLTLGTSELSLRLVPLLFGTATSATALWIGRRWLHPFAAAVLILLCVLGKWLSHYRFELKHYSADAFFALLLPALAAWAAADDAEDKASGADASWRWTRWWAVASLAQWFANGAVFVTPGCAVLLAAVILRRDGQRAALRFAAGGMVWLLSFGVHYALSLQYAHHSSYLRSYWSGDVLPESVGLVETLVWIGNRFERLAENPAGTALGALLWAAVFCGFAFGRRPLLSAMFASVVLAAVGLAGLRLVPLNDRLALWIVPAIYLGVTLLLDTGLRQSAAGWFARRWGLLAAAAGAAAFAVYVTGSILDEGRRNLDLGLPRDSNHGLDDRAAVRWLMARRQAGDALISTRLGWPALRWYGFPSLARPLPGGRLPDGSVMYAVSDEREIAGCRAQFREALRPHRRVLVYVGFPDMPDDFYDLLVRELSSVGEVIEAGQFSSLSRTAIVRLDDSSIQGFTSPPSDEGRTEQPPRTGCLSLRVARRW